MVIESLDTIDNVIVFRARDVTKVYHTGDLEVRALDGVDFELFEGEMLVLAPPDPANQRFSIYSAGSTDQRRER